MAEIGHAMRQVFESLWASINTIWINDILDILAVAFIIYHIVRLVRETRAMQLVKGIAGFMVVAFIANSFNMITLSFFFRDIVSVGIYVLVALFQPELRRALEQLGRANITALGRISPLSEDVDGTQQLIEILGDSCDYLSRHRSGGLIVIERQTKLGEFVRTGTIIDADPSVELIGNIFFVNSPLHDGAMVIRDNRLYSAGCYLPLSQNSEIGKELGTRHRAGLGMSEVSDALVIIVSEETGAISVALDSRLQRNLSVQNLKKLLGAKLLSSSPDQQNERRFRIWRGKR